MSKNHEESKEEVFAPIPTFTNEQLMQCAKEGSFVEPAFELYKSLGIAIVKLVNITENSDEHHQVRKTKNFQIIQGMMLRAARLMTSVLKLSQSGHHAESVSILKRCIDETAINIMFLLKEDKPELFHQYRKSSLTQEAELLDFVNDQVKTRGDAERQIETSIKRHITRAAKLAEIDLSKVPRKHTPWGGSLRDKFEKLGMPDFYLFYMRIPSHAVHGTFVDLIQHYLEEDGDLLIPSDNPNRLDDAHLVTSGLLTGLSAQAYCDSYFFDDEVRDVTHDYFSEFCLSFKDINSHSIKSIHGQDSIYCWKPKESPAK